ncbi:Uncharacterized protein EJ110_NYTH13977 [Nymphaea thermarum]|nr:Uncharacterized protein EJ110_NYTH13977 [Nymphaea thermarum]
MAVQPNLMIRTSCSSARIHDPKHCSRPRASISNGSLCNTFLYLGLVVVLSSILVIFIVFCMATSPCNPSFSVAVACFNFSGSRPSARWDLDIVAGNPNRYNGIDYRQIGVHMVYHGEVLAKTNLLPFYHEKLNSTTISTHLAMESGYAAEPVAGLVAADQSAGEVEFDVWISAVVQFKTFRNVQRRRFLWFQCNSIRVYWQEGAGKRSSSRPIKCDNEPL